MTKRVTILAVDNGYRDHAKSLMVNCRRIGKWDGDFAILCPMDFDGEDFKQRGIHVFRTPEETWSYAVKFDIFDPIFWRWEQALYLDCDILIQRDLRPICDEQAMRFPKILCDGSQCLPGGLGTSIMQDWEHFGRLSGVGPEVMPEAYQRLRERFPHVDQPLLCTGIVLFDPESIPGETIKRLDAVREEFREINPQSCDQDVINSVLYDRLEPLPKGVSCWWAFDEPCNRVASAPRGWQGDEFPAIVHYWGAFAPWLEKTPDAGAYLNERLGRVCRELYLENLADFDKEFPIR
jgi:hypothetical protein